MKTCRTYLVSLVVCVMICSSQEVIGQQSRLRGPTLPSLFLIPDSLKTPSKWISM
jgi:hypothetical protein